MTRGFIYAKDNMNIISEIKRIALEVIKDNTFSNKYADYVKIRNDLREKVGDYMGKAILAVIVTLIVGYLGTVVGLELLGNWDEFGLLIAIAVMGAFIIYFNDKK